MLQCRQCNHQGEFEDFVRENRSPNGRTNLCRVCQRKRNNNVRNGRRKFYRQLLDELKTTPCHDCGGLYPPYVMDFDHVRGEKMFGLSKVVNQLQDLPLDVVLAEVAKCEIVCANCHRIRTYNRSADGRDA